MWLVKIIPLILQSFATMILNPLLWLVLVLVGFQYRRTENMRQDLFGMPGDSAFHMTAVSLLYGIIGGFVGSLAMVTVGISINNIGFDYLWPLAILLMLINVRFLCFSYAGGILSLSYLLTGHPHLDVPQLIALVGLLHMIEAVLIFLNGHHDALPVYMRTDRGKVVGGYSMQKFWPIPVVALMIVVLNNPDFAKQGIQMPDWWPLLKSGFQGQEDKIQYLILPVAAALGYGDFALTSLPHEKSRLSALYLFIYSIVLLALAVLSSHFSILAWAAALLSPLGHELVIKLGKDVERKGMPLFQQEEIGLRIFEVIPHTPADAAGLKRGDLLISVNGREINTKQDFTSALSEMPWYVEVEYLPYKTTEVKRQVIRKNITQQFGVLFPPEPWEQPNVEIGTTKSFIKTLKRLFFRT